VVSREVYIRNAKLMGGIGAILELVGGLIPYLGWILPFAGLVLVLLALKKISDETGKPTIFKDFLISFIFMAIGNILFALMGGITFLGSLGKGFKAIHLGAALFAFLLSWVVVMIGAYFLRLSFNTTAEATGIGTFETAATLIFYGAILTIIIIGGLVLLAGRIAEIVAFFSLPDVLEVYTS
jgi:uncharacterized membrane protein